MELGEYYGNTEEHSLHFTFIFDYAESSSNFEESQTQRHPKVEVIEVSSYSTTSTEENRPSTLSELSQIIIETRQEGNSANESCHLAEDEPIYVKDALKNSDLEECNG